MPQIVWKQAVATLLLGFTLAACGSGDNPAPPPLPPQPTGTGVPPEERVFRFDQTLTVAGLARTYTVTLPPTYYDTTTKVPLIIAMHGGGGSAAQFESTSLLTPKADAARFAVVYPNGTAGLLGIRTWNGGGCCGHAVANNIDDVDFIRHVITHVTTDFRIDPARVYATGHSNGGIMAYRLACELSDRIAAIAPNAAAMMVPSCAPGRAVPVLHLHSRLDTQVPITGGFGTGPAGVPFPTLASAMDQWVSINGCATVPTVQVTAGQLTRTTWEPCRAGTVVDLYVTEDGGHSWPGGLPGSSVGDPSSTAIDANDLLLAFFLRHTLP